MEWATNEKDKRAHAGEKSDKTPALCRMPEPALGISQDAAGVHKAEIENNCGLFSCIFISGFFNVLNNFSTVELFWTFLKKACASLQNQTLFTSWPSN